MQYFQKNKLAKSIFLCALIAAGAFFLAKESFSLAETGYDPSVSGSTYISPSTVETGGSVNIYLSILNTVAEVLSVGVILESPSGLNVISIDKLTGNSQGYWHGTVVIPSGVETGVWKLSKIIVSYSTGEAKEYSPSASFTVKNSASENIVCKSFDYSDWSDCQNGIKIRNVKASYPAGCQGGTPEIRQSCVDEEVATSSCVQDEWLCANWGKCVDGSQTKLCDLVFDCANDASQPPVIRQACSDDKVTSTPKIICERFDYSDWSDCQNGIKIRNVKASYPAGCQGGTPEIRQSCSPEGSLKKCTEGDWKCGEWSSCFLSTKQYRNCSLAVNCAIVSETKPQMAKDCPIENTPTIKESIGSGYQEKEAVRAEDEYWNQICSRLGMDSQGDCELYFYQNTVVKDCLSGGLNDQAACFRYFLEKYGRPLKCQGMNIEDCDLLIKDLILPEFKNIIGLSVRQELADYAGRTAVLDSEKKELTVELEQSGGSATSSKKEIKIESALPLAPSGDKVSVILSSVAVTEHQQILSPVAIIFDANGNGIPDDTEKRMDNVPTDAKMIDKKELSFLSGIDQALINGKSLEQPKLNNNLKESESLAISSIETVRAEETKAGDILRLKGKAEPNQVVTLFLYSVMPIVLTAKADSYGNWIYDLDRSLVDGKHEVYAAVNNSEGRILEASLPKPFFIQEAKAVTIDDFIGVQEVASIPDTSNNIINFYLVCGGSFILLLIAGFLFIRKKLA